MIVDLSYLNISILNYISSNKYGVILIANKSTSNRLTLIQFYKDYSYEIRTFDNKYQLNLEGALAFTSTSDDGSEYYMAPSNPPPNTAFVSYKFGVRMMYPVVKLKKQQPSPKSYRATTFQGVVPVADKTINLNVQKIIGPDEEIFKKKSPIEIITNKDIYTVDLT
jgi:hypothetical protein